VLVPLSEIAANWIVPATAVGKAATVAQLAKAVGQAGVTRTELTL
jgi:hypothetical protein